MSHYDAKRVLVTGGRNFGDRDAVFAILDELDPPLIIHGGATGADELAYEWARRRGRIALTYFADWRPGGILDRSAGPKRNRKMARDGAPTLCVPFPGGTGTADMVAIMHAAHVPIYPTLQMLAALRTPEAKP